MKYKRSPLYPSRKRATFNRMRVRRRGEVELPQWYLTGVNGDRELLEALRKSHGLSFQGSQFIIRP